MEKLENVLAKYIWIVILILSIPAIWALTVPGYYGASDDLHVAWLFEMDHTIKLGQFPPRYVPDLSYQFGYPLFNFVFPLPFYLGDIFHLVGLNMVDSVKFVFLITIPLSMYFMFKLIRQFSGVLLSLAAAVLYVYTPYRATDLYVRGAIGEIVGFTFLPLICLALMKIMNSPKPYKLKWVGVGAIGIGTLVLTHDIMAYMFFPCLAVLGFILAFLNHKKKENIAMFAAMGILGLVISIYFWFPAVSDSKLMKYDTVFNFEDHYPTLIQLIKPYWGYGASVPGPYDGMSFFIGIFNWLGFLTGLIILIFWRKRFSKNEKIILLWGYGVFLLSIFMMNFRSAPLWKVLPELPYFQFPWRFLILTTFVTPIFLITLEKIKYSKQIALGLVLIIVASNAFQFRPHDFLGRMDAYYLNRYVPYPDASDDYKMTQEEYLRLPRDNQKRPDKIYPAFYADMPLTVEPLMTNPLDYEAKLGVNQQTQVNFNKYSFPGWQVVIDGKLMDTNAGGPLGQITFPLSGGYHDVRVFFAETGFKKFFDFISILGLILAVFLLLPKKWFRLMRG